jgi:sugar lactone lactonase YvrE
VAIQHGADIPQGSLNVWDWKTGQNRSWTLHGRPGFAFPTTRPNTFVIGIERRIVLFNTDTESEEILVDGLEQHTQGTIINDGVVYDGHLVFGCKDLTFSEKKAGLYLLRAGERQAVLLRDDQICSNGKAITSDAAGNLTLYDIDSPSKQVIAWQLDLAAGQLHSPRVVIDFTAGEVFPDGMIMTPDGQGLIIAFYDPRESQHGEARWYEIATGNLIAVWQCPQSPRVTCPQLISRDGKIELVLTTADEGMSPELRAKCPHAGCLFIGPTDFAELNDAPNFPAKA